MCTARLLTVSHSMWWGTDLSIPPDADRPPWTEWQTLVKTLPCPKLRLRVVMIQTILQGLDLTKNPDGLLSPWIDLDSTSIRQVLCSLGKCWINYKKITYLNVLIIKNNKIQKFKRWKKKQDEKKDQTNLIFLAFIIWRPVIESTNYKSLNGPFGVTSVILHGTKQNKKALNKLITVS